MLPLPYAPLETATGSGLCPDAQQHISSDKAVHGENAAADLAQQTAAHLPRSNAEGSGREMSAPTDRHTQSADVAAPAALNVPARNPAVAVDQIHGETLQQQDFASATASIPPALVGGLARTDKSRSAEQDQQASAHTVDAAGFVREELDHQASNPASPKTAHASESPIQAALDSALRPVGEELDARSLAENAPSSLRTTNTDSRLSPAAAEGRVKANVVGKKLHDQSTTGKMWFGSVASW